MPIYTPQNTDKFYRVFDANGLEWKDVTEANTDTGEIEQFQRNEQGVFFQTMDGDAARIRRIIPTPISMVPIGEKEIDADA